jgi:hypothetical protein
LGYYFRDALYLVDDYKPEVTRPTDVVKLLQSYGDRAGRGRLQADAKANVTRPIRGLLVATGEDVPDHAASSVARSVIIAVPNAAKDAERAQRCGDATADYRGLTADFIAYLIHEDRLSGFAERVAEHKRRFYALAAGRQNDARVAGNLALLAAAFEEFVAYMGDAWEGLEAETRAFLEADLPGLLDQTLDVAHGQQASEVFLSTLQMLLAHGRVRFYFALNGPTDERIPVIGRRDSTSNHIDLCIPLALAEVQNELRREGREPLKVTDATLIAQLRGDGVIVTPTDKKAKSTRQVRIAGQRYRCVLIRRDALLGGDEVPESDP